MALPPSDNARLTAIREFFLEEIPFNRVLGIGVADVRLFHPARPDETVAQAQGVYSVKRAVQ